MIQWTCPIPDIPLRLLRKYNIHLDSIQHDSTQIQMTIQNTLLILETTEVALCRLEHGPNATHITIRIRAATTPSAIPVRADNEMLMQCSLYWRTRTIVYMVYGIVVVLETALISTSTIAAPPMLLSLRCFGPLLRLFCPFNCRLSAPSNHCFAMEIAMEQLVTRVRGQRQDLRVRYAPTRESTESRRLATSVNAVQPPSVRWRTYHTPLDSSHPPPLPKPRYPMSVYHAGLFTSEHVASGPMLVPAMIQPAFSSWFIQC